jgi:hypothetical protein
MVLSSPEPVTSFDWKSLNPHLPWGTWKKVAGFLEEWKGIPAYSPMGVLFSESRFRCAGWFSDQWEHVIWEAVEPGLFPMVLLDGRWGAPRGCILCHLEVAPTKEDLLGNQIARLERRCVLIMQQILDARDLPLDPMEVSFLLDALLRSVKGKTGSEDLEIVTRFWWAALELFHPDLYGKLVALADCPSFWAETAKYLAQVPRERLLEVYRALQASANGDARRLAGRIGAAHTPDKRCCPTVMKGDFDGKTA